MDIKALPKTELHLHLEGAVPHSALLELIRKYGDGKTFPDTDAIRAKLQHGNFSQFVAAWLWKNKYLREYEDFRLIAADLARNLASNGVWYAEVSFSPGDFQKHGLLLQPLAQAIRRGLQEFGAGDNGPTSIRINLIVDMVRDFGPERGLRWLEETREIAHDTGIVAVGIGGSEAEFPAAPYARLFRRAEEFGLHRVAHAGECAGAASIWAALNELGVERIGHGTRSFEDPALLVRLRRERIPLEICLTSNVCTGVVPAIRQHPFLHYFRSGLRITLSSDDPAMFDTDIAAEYARAQAEFELSDNELVRIARTGFEAAFLPEPDRAAFLARFDALAKPWT
ncbi:MAG TPA: adenosine deaminase [Candidatus Binatia bacterium]|jgi:adenosine deaminase